VTGNAEADAFYARQESADAARGQRIAAISDTSDCNGDPTCVVAAKGFAALAEVGGGSAQPPQQYVAQPSTAVRFGLALVGQISPLASAAVAWRGSDNSARTAEAQFGFLGGVVRDVSNASARNSEAAFGMLPELAPSISAGGHLAMGDLQDGHNAGRDLAADGGSVDNSETTTVNVRDINTGTQNSGLIGDGRQGSPGPYRGVNTGEGCVGPGCQPINPLPVEDDEGEG
jgi:hypothetical protein